MKTNCLTIVFTVGYSLRLNIMLLVCYRSRSLLEFPWNILIIRNSLPPYINPQKNEHSVIVIAIAYPRPVDPWKFWKCAFICSGRDQYSFAFDDGKEKFKLGSRHVTSPEINDGDIGGFYLEIVVVVISKHIKWQIEKKKALIVVFEVAWLHGMMAIRTCMSNRWFNRKLLWLTINQLKLCDRR